MTKHLWKIAGVSLAVIAFTAACNPTEPAATAPAAPEAAAPAPAPDYASLLANPARPVADAARDASRKPTDVLAFSKVMTGNTVLEIEAGGGYYTELLASAVGPSGKVIMQNPNFGPEFEKDVAARVLDNRLPNVTRSTTAFDTLEAPDGTVDVVTWFQGPHELYYKPTENPAGFGDPVKAYAEIFRVLKPGGYFVVMDHVAAQGSPPTTGNDLHRIDPLLIKAAATQAGFVIDDNGESPLLANPADDHTKGVFDETIRGKTDQVLLRYKKPA